MRSAGFLKSVVTVAMLLTVMPQAVWGKEDKVSIELNRVSEVDGACRMSFVFTNGLEVPVETLSIETVLFNKEQSVERFLVLKSRPLSPQKIRVQQFDIRGIACNRLGKLLLNDVKACKAGDLSTAGCLEKIEPSSRAGFPFISTATSN